MFSYYGTKKKLAKYYPAPKEDVIIEPFCGAAMYSLYDDNWKNQVILNDKYDKVYLIWNFLINKANEKDIQNLPDLTNGTNLDDLNLSIEEKFLLGFFANPSSAMPKKTVTERGQKSWKRHKDFIIQNLYKIKHWKIYNKDYSEIDNIKATWFIDPPYQFGGQYYHSSTSNKSINYDNLSNWVKLRQGQIIVCENDKSTWIEHKPLIKLKGQLHTTQEVIYYQEN